MYYISQWACIDNVLYITVGLYCRLTLNACCLLECLYVFFRVFIPYIFDYCLVNKKTAITKQLHTHTHTQTCTHNSWCLVLVWVTTKKTIGVFLYWCALRPTSQRFFIHSCIYLFIISYLVTYLGIMAFLCWCAVKQSNKQTNKKKPANSLHELHMARYQVIINSNNFL